MVTVTAIAVSVGLVLVLGSLASGAGVGGGGLFIPLFVLLLGDNKLAIPASKAGALGVALALFTINASRKRPTSVGRGTRPMIDYSVAMLLEPLTLVGTIIGVRLNKMLPFVLLASLMTLLMLSISLKTLQRALRLHRVESEELRTPLLIEEQQQPQPKSNSANEAGASVTVGRITDTALESQRMRNIELVVERESVQYPLPLLGGLFLCWLCSLSSTYIVSAKSGFGIECLSTSYFVVLTSFALLLCTLAALNAFSEMRFQKLKRSTQVVPEEEMLWSVSRVFSLCGVSLLAGLLSAMVGVGGSTVKGPFLVHFFANPNVAASTSGFMLLSTCSSSMIQFVFLGMLDPLLAFIFFVAGFLAASFGARVWIALINKCNRRSYIVFLLACYVFIAAISVAAISAFEYVNGAIPEIGSVC